MNEITFRESLNESLKENLRKDKNIFCFGQDIAILGGSFGATFGLLEEFGSKRIIDTPISEIAIVGAGIGAALGGLRPVVEIMYIDFTTCCMDMIVNQMSKIHYMFGSQFKVPIVLRVISGAMGNNAAQHSQNFYSFFVHVPGLIVVAPSNPYDAKGLLNESIRNDNPVIFIENKRIYNKKGYVPNEFYYIPIGSAEVKKEGKDLTIVATQALVYDALEVSRDLEKNGISVEVIDPRTLKPLDKETILKSVKKTGKLIIADEDWISCGISSEISAIVCEEAIDYLDAPIIRVGPPDTPCPFSPPLEKAYIPGKEEIIKGIKKIGLL